MIVVDASALVEVLLSAPAAARAADVLFGGNETLHAPHLLDIEIAQVLRRHAAKGVITAARGEAAMADLAAFPCTRYPHAPLLRIMWSLRHGVSAYDAAYVALAVLLDAPLLTRDSRLAAAVAGRVRVELV